MGWTMFGAVMLAAASVAPAGAAQPNIGPAALCADAAFRQQLDERSLKCIGTPFGVAISVEGEVDAFADLLTEAGESFTRHFAPPPRPIAVVPRNLLSDGETATLEKAGYFPFPWFSSADTKGREEIAQSIARQISAVLPLSKSEVNARAAEIAKKLVGTKTDALPHELSHLWFKTLYDGTIEAPTSGYASSAPDWLDEVAAVLAERKLIDAREQVIAQAMERGGGDLIPLGRLFAMDHPHLAAGLANEPKPGTAEARGTVVKLRVDATTRSDLSRDPGTLFYAEVHSFADFLISTSGNQRIFADIAQEIRGGGTMEQWLKDEGTRLGVPSTINALDATWREWLGARYSDGRAGDSG